MPVAEINGLQLSYEVVGAGAPLVYLAGTRFDSAKDKAIHIRQYAHGFRTIIPDPRGMGGSTHTAEVEPEDWVKDLGELLTYLQSPRFTLLQRPSERESRSASRQTTRSMCEVLSSTPRLRTALRTATSNVCAPRLPMSSPRSAGRPWSTTRAQTGRM